MKTLRALIVAAILLPAFAAAADQPQARWFDSYFPYRLTLGLEKPASGAGPRLLSAAPDALIEALRPACVDVLNDDTFAYDKAVLVDPAAGRIVGGFRLVPSGDDLDVEGDFADLSAGKPSKWTGNSAGIISFEDADTGSARFKSLVAAGKEIANRQLGQELQLKPGALYLLEYWIRTEAEKGNIYVSLHNPAKKLFDEVPCSYYSKITEPGKWVKQRVLYRPETAACRLRISTGLVGRAAVGAISLRPVQWALAGEVPEGTDSLDLYAIMQAGHRLVQPDESVISSQRPAETITVKRISAHCADLNPDGVKVDAGDGVRAWSVPPYLPLRAETMRATEPQHSAPAIRATLLRGQSTTIVLAIDTGTPRIIFPQTSCDLPFSPRFERVAAIPVFDGFFPQTRQFETRYDALVDPNFRLAPPDNNGIHILAVTLTAPPDAKARTVDGKIRLTVQTQEPITKSIELPVRLTVLGPLVKPMRHFGTLFGGQHFLVRYKKAPEMFVRDSVTVADYCGFGPEIPTDDWVARLSLPDRPDPAKAPIRDLARKYYQRMLDFDLVPQSLTLYSDYTYKVEDTAGEGMAPKLTNWDFAEYDKAIDQLVIGRDAPWLCVWHTNGHQMDLFLLGNGVMYTPRPRPADSKEPWKQIKYEQYLALAADYFEHVAAHLDAKGVLDRAIIVLDESDETTYPLMLDVVKALRAQPHAKRIRWGHTTYKTTIYTQKQPDGKLIMDEVLDVPMPDNDEHFNFFEQEWMSRFQRPGKQPWVYYVESDHFALHYAGLSTLVTPLKLAHFGVHGWYNWASFIWSYPTPDYKLMGPEYPNGPLVNPWLNPYYHHGYGLLCFFYPPDPRGPADKPTNRIIPSYRLALMRDGIQDQALLEVLSAGKDDAGQPVSADPSALREARAALDRLWARNPVQWYLSYDSYRQARNLLYGLNRGQEEP